MGYLGAIWWIILASLDRFQISDLQRPWNSFEKTAIFIYFPMCIVLAGEIAGILCKQIKGPAVCQHNSNIKYSSVVFFIVSFVFLVQCLLYTPPLWAESPNDARLLWGFPFIHVFTEITIRSFCLLVIGKSMCEKRIKLKYFAFYLISVIYTILVVSRSFMVELLFYGGLYSVFRKYPNTLGLRIIFRALHLGIVCIICFYYFGKLRQGSEFDIVDYAEINAKSALIAWIFGYFLVNFDNLALIIRENYTNDAITNVFGSLLQSLKLHIYTNVDNYIYVGKFNLGTAFRPYVLDFGVLWGGILFILTLALFLWACALCNTKCRKISAIFLSTYVIFCIPITSRIEETPYLFALIWIVISDKIEA